MQAMADKTIGSLRNHDDDGHKTVTNLLICIGNHMISSAIWNKKARVNFSKANKIARARRASAIWGL